MTQHGLRQLARKKIDSLAGTWYKTEAALSVCLDSSVGQINKRNLISIMSQEEIREEKQKLVIVGISSTARHVYHFVRYHDMYDVVGFAVNEQYRTVDSFMDLPVYTLEHLPEECPHREFKVFVAVLWNRLNADRRKVYEYCKRMGYEMVNLISPLAAFRGKIDGDNCWVHDFAVVQNDTTICSDTFLMAHCFLGGYSHVGPHCFFAARSLLGGGSTVEEQSFFGFSSSVFDATHIGKKCIVGACTAIKRNMPDFSKCITSADNTVMKQYMEDEVENKLLYRLNVR